MTRLVDYRFTIDSMTPDELPMARLAAYMCELANLLGYKHTVHFRQLESGSTVVVSQIEYPSIPKVLERVRGAAYGEGELDALKAMKALDDLLYDDNATGEILDEEGAQILAFPGRTRRKPPVLGPFNQAGSLDGLLVRVGGKDKPAHAQLQSGDRSWSVDVSRDQAQEMAAYLYQPIRVRGVGRWTRNSDAVWQLNRFRVDSFEVLGNKSLSELMTEAQQSTKDWSDVDPLTEWHELRGDRGPH
jgi:hypothetical protein